MSMILIVIAGVVAVGVIIGVVVLVASQSGE